LLRLVTWFHHSVLGTGHKVTARVGRSDLGWAMENLWAVSMGRGWATKQKPISIFITHYDKYNSK
jgi:hypothetical protein